MTRDDGRLGEEDRSRKTILVLTPQFPYPPHQGTTLRNYNLVSELAERHDVHLLSFGQPKESQGTPLDRLCKVVQVVTPPQRSMRHRVVTLLTSRLPDMAQRLPSAEFAAALETLLAQEALDIVQVEGIELAQYLFQVTERRGRASRPLLVFDDHNAEYVIQQRAFETDVRQPRRWIAAAYSLVQWRRLRRYERWACRAADRVVAVSKTDAEALRQLAPGLEPFVVPNGVDLSFCSSTFVPLSDRQAPGMQDLVFVGKMDFRPNVDAVLWFSQKVLPLVRKEAPETRLWVVGKDPHPRLTSLWEDPAVVLTGWVDDVRPYIAGAAVYVIPLRIGGGTRLKVLEAMGMGKAIVSTSLGCEGFELVADRDLVLADEPEQFAAETVNLLNDAVRRKDLGSAARDFAAKYDWRTIVPLMEQVYGEG
jgi:sugar transferase (PEP-CTERM/EpsH1 system associated)